MLIQRWRQPLTLRATTLQTLPLHPTAVAREVAVAALGAVETATAVVDMAATAAVEVATVVAAMVAAMVAVMGVAAVTVVAEVDTEVATESRGAGREDSIWLTARRRSPSIHNVRACACPFAGFRG